MRMSHNALCIISWQQRVQRTNTTFSHVDNQTVSTASAVAVYTVPKMSRHVCSRGLATSIIARQSSANSNHCFAAKHKNTCICCTCRSPPPSTEGPKHNVCVVVQQRDKMVRVCHTSSVSEELLMNQSFSDDPTQVLCSVALCEPPH
jgi:hypothetical protein